MGNIFGNCVGAVPRVHSLASVGGGGGSPASPPSSPTNASQPATNPSEWFLSHDEITTSRGGVSRSDLSLYTTGDHVDAYASSDAYFRQLLRDMDAGGVASIWLMGWALNHTVPLDPTSPNASDTTLQAIVERAVRKRGVQVRALVWVNLFQHKECLAARDWMTELGASSPKGSALMLFDNRLPHHVSSHHQKGVVIRHTNGTFVAFVGGLDITADRWDTLAHDQARLREARGWRGDFDGWIDASVRLEGAAARDVAATFAARWNSRVKPDNCWKQELLDFENLTTYEPVPAPLPPETNTEPTVTSAISKVSVQIVRTFSPLRALKMYPEMAPSGELSLLQSRIKAIALAKNWIFIQDQYFFFMPQLMEVLRMTLAKHPALRVVVVIQSPNVTTQSKFAGYEKLVFLMAQPLLHGFPRQLQLYTTKSNRNLYIHAKLLIVDETFLSISSANWNRRSMTSDSELGASIVDANLVDTPDGVRVGQTVREFQLKKLQELTGRGADEWRRLTIVQRCDALAQSAIEAATILQKLEIEDKWEFVLIADEFTLHVVDPDDVNHAEHAGSSDEE